MNSARMIQEFQIQYDKLDSENLPDVEIPQMFVFLNDAVDELLTEGRQYFEQNSKVRDDLSSHIKTLYILPEKEEGSTRIIFDYKKALENYTKTKPTNPSYIPVYYFITGICESSIGEGDSKKEGITRLSYTQQDDIQPLLADPFNKPTYADIVPIVIENQSIIAIPPSFLSLNLLKGVFILEPKEISQTQNCDLPKQLHKKIVKRAVEIALENVESQRVSTFNK